MVLGRGRVRRVGWLFRTRSLPSRGRHPPFILSSAIHFAKPDTVVLTRPQRWVDIAYGRRKFSTVTSGKRFAISRTTDVHHHRYSKVSGVEAQKDRFDAALTARIAARPGSAISLQCGAANFATPSRPRLFGPTTPHFYASSSVLHHTNFFIPNTHR